jgi:hypothetical protein
MPIPIKPMTFLETRFFIPFRTNLHCRMLGSVFDIGTFCLLQMLIHQRPQIPPAPANGQPEDHREDVLPHVRRVEVAWIGRAQDPHHFDVAYEGIADYHPQPLVDVSNFHPSATETPFDR